MHCLVSKGLLIVVPQLFESVQVLICCPDEGHGDGLHSLHDHNSLHRVVVCGMQLMLSAGLFFTVPQPFLSVHVLVLNPLLGHVAG